MLRLRRLNFYSIFFAFGVSVLIILAASRYIGNTNYRQSSESRRNTRNYLKIEDGENNSPQPLPTNPDDGSPNIEKILEKSRSKVKFDLTNYNFYTSGVQKLEDLLLESGGRPIRSLIVSAWRSGSTFLGEILNAMPGNFYHYEPLMHFDKVQIRSPPYSEKALSTIKSMFNCNFNDMDEYFEYGKVHAVQYSHNSRPWDHCKYEKELCLDPDFTSKYCKLFPFHSMKVVRFRLRLVQELLDDKQLNLNVVLLIRDPRGVMQSRQHHDWCLRAPDCWRPELVCADMISDYLAAGRLLKQYPGRVMVLRYEDLALNPNNTAHKLLNFLKLSPTPSFEEFLHSHTTVEVGGAFSTFRVSREVPFRWKNILNFSYVEEIQMVCKYAMDLWGYRMAHNASHLASKEFNPLDQFKVPQ
ncbi:hypothetical protein ABMA28_007580 [Loxostege sticticalis]|uniref:Sulfotransferase domain-containing protein n=1 Tax=Loxostege sticticalis TaxID=481309 RepID=A0ABD0SI10_LOXSC